LVMTVPQQYNQALANMRCGEGRLAFVGAMI
jgi:hypothetical protein